MNDTHIIIGIATLASLLAIVATLVVIPGLYNEMNELSQRFVELLKTIIAHMKGFNLLGI